MNITIRTGLCATTPPAYEGGFKAAVLVALASPALVVVGRVSGFLRRQLGW